MFDRKEACFRMKLALPEPVQHIIRTLSACGYEAYVVGGCVRDAILGRSPDDWDITTSARPGQVKALFPRTVDTGIAHGTVTVLLHGAGFEVTTYRIDGAYEDGRHPKEVSFTGNLEEDLMRRDFTINAMAYNEETGLVDVFGGLEDLERKQIRCVGVAEERFGEDALRILRGVRFCAQLGFELDETTRKAMTALAPTLAKISAERIQVELTKLLLSKNPEYFGQLYDYGISRVILPEYDALEAEQRKMTGWQLKELERRASRKQGAHFERQKQSALRLAAVLQYFKDAQVSKILRRLKYDNRTIKNVRGILQFQDYEIKEEAEGVRRALYAMGEELFPLELEFRFSHTEIEEEILSLEHISHIRQDILEKGECVSLKGLAVSGNDLLEIGCPKGQAVGTLLAELLEMVLEKPERNRKDWLLETARRKSQEMRF